MGNSLTLPKLGESIHEASVVKWLKNVGDYVKKDEAVVEVSTDKVTSEIPAVEGGVITEIFVQEGSECGVGEALCLISPEKSEAKEEEVFSPVVLKLAAEKNLSIEDLKKMSGSGANGRVTKKDLQTMEVPKSSSPSDFVRKQIADNVTLSAKEIPQASLMTKIDLTDLLKLSKEKGIKVTPFLIKAIGVAAKKFPKVSKVPGEVHVGIAVNVNDNVIVPVLKNADTLPIDALVQESNDLIKRAREGSLEHRHMEGGTITFSNFGMAGIEAGIPLVRYPEVAIIAMGAIVKEVVVTKDDALQIRSRSTLTLSFDHRVIDGIYGCHFMQEIKKLVENASH